MGRISFGKLIIRPKSTCHVARAYTDQTHLITNPMLLVSEVSISLTKWSYLLCIVMGTYIITCFD